MNGIRVVTPNSKINTSNPSEVTIDTSKAGAMKVFKTIQFKTKDLSDTYLSNTVTVGRKIIAHGLGYSPAFMGFVYGGGSTSNLSGQSVPLPSRGPLTQPVDLSIYSDVLNLTVDGIEIPPGEPDTITVIIFAESLDT